MTILNYRVRSLDPSTGGFVSQTVPFVFDDVGGGFSVHFHDYLARHAPALSTTLSRTMQLPAVPTNDHLGYTIERGESGVTIARIEVIRAVHVEPITQIYRVAIQPAPGRDVEPHQWETTHLRLLFDAALMGNPLPRLLAQLVEWDPRDFYARPRGVQIAVFAHATHPGAMLVERLDTGEVLYLLVPVLETEVRRYTLNLIARNVTSTIALPATRAVLDVLREGNHLITTLPNSRYRVTHGAGGTIEVFNCSRSTRGRLVYTLTAVDAPILPTVAVPRRSAADRAIRLANTVANESRSDRGYVMAYAKLCEVFRTRPRATLAELAEATGYNEARVQKTLDWAEEKDWVVLEARGGWRLAEDVAS